jgi:Ca2+-binding RTX toxin-like protein
MRKHLNFSPHIEALDERALMSVTLAGSVLEVDGTGGGDQIKVTLASPTRLQVTVNTTGDNAQFNLSLVTSILIKAKGGNDLIVIGPSITLPTEVRAWTGNDTIRGGGGSDLLDGGAGNDNVDGRGGNDHILGGAGNDYLVGGAGDDYLNGQAGNDLLSGGTGTNTLAYGTDLDMTFNIPAPGGIGTVQLSNPVPGNPFVKRFTVTAVGAPPNASADIFVGGFYIGRLNTNILGSGQLVFQHNYDANGTGVPDFLEGVPATFPEITDSTVVTAHVVSPIDQTFSSTIGQLKAASGQ